MFAHPAHQATQARTPKQSRTTPAQTEHVGKRQLERSVSWTGPERLRCLWYRLRLTVRDMNDASRRMVELQAPWIR
ncbi:MAG: hypothetical protein ACLPN6_00040 [Streptosporangiaceae bacterium]|jgi:hypothetical protein|nr:hypothetical protein [Actinomycetota bacterium]